MAVTFSRHRLFQLLNLPISKNFKSYASLTFEQAQAKAPDKSRRITKPSFCLMFFNVVYCFRDWHSTTVLSSKNQSDVGNLVENCLRRFDIANIYCCKISTDVTKDRKKNSVQSSHDLKLKTEPKLNL